MDFATNSGETDAQFQLGDPDREELYQ